MRTDFLGKAYTSRSLPLAAQTLINLVAEQNESGAGDAGMFYNAPGLLVQYDFGDGPHRGSLESGDFAWVVSGDTLYRYTSPSSVTVVGTIPGTARVSMAANDTQVVVAHETGWLVVTKATLATVSPINAPANSVITYQDSYIIFVLPNGTYGWTNIGDATDIDVLNFASAEGNPDPIIAPLSDHRELWLFGTKSTEVAQTSGDADLAFTRTAFIEHGCAARFSPAKADNTVLWLGRDENGAGIVFRADGYSPVRVSDFGMEEAIKGYGDISDAYGYCYQQAGHTYYILGFPGRGTWAYDMASSTWGQRAYRNLATGALEEHRGVTHCFLGSTHLVGDRDNGKLYALDLDTFTDNGDPIYRERTASTLSRENMLMKHNRLELIGEFGVGLDGIQLGTDPQVLMQFSDDGCRTWSNAQARSLGEIGSYTTRAIWRRLGMSRRRVYRLSTSDPVRIAWYGLNLT